MPSREVTVIGCGLAPVLDGARLRMYDTSCQTCSSLKPANGGIWLPGTPARTVWNRSASAPPYVNVEPFSAGPRSP